MGAHRGEEAPIYEWFGKKVIWIEANPIIFQDLTDNLIKYKFQKAYQALISNSDNQKIDFYLSSNDYASSSIFKFGNLSSGKNSLWPDKNLKHIDKKELLSITIDSLIKINSIDIKIKQQGIWTGRLHRAGFTVINCSAIKDVLEMIT